MEGNKSSSQFTIGSWELKKEGLFARSPNQDQAGMTALEYMGNRT